MTEEYCQGAREAIIEWEHTEPDRVQGGGNIYVPNNGGDLTYEWVENLQFRRYFIVGVYSIGNVPNCGLEGGYIAGYYKHNSLGLELARKGNGWAIPWDSETLEYDCYANARGKNGVDELIQGATASEEGYLIPPGDETIFNPPGIFTGRQLYYVASCTNDTPRGSEEALSIGSGSVFRSNNRARYYLSIKENEQEIHQYGSPDTGFVGSGQFAWDEPTRAINFYPGYTETRTANITKSSPNSIIKLTTEPYTSVWDTIINGGWYVGVPRTRYNFKEFLDGEETGRAIFAGVVSGGVPVPSELNVTCVALCPEGTCTVDCGTHYCCYGSDGVAVESVPK